jgi:hypothetical protein
MPVWLMIFFPEVFFSFWYAVRDLYLGVDRLHFAAEPEGFLAPPLSLPVHDAVQPGLPF